MKPMTSMISMISMTFMMEHFEKQMSKFNNFFSSWWIPEHPYFSARLLSGEGSGGQEREAGGGLARGGLKFTKGSERPKLRASGCHATHQVSKFCSWGWPRLLCWQSWCSSSRRMEEVLDPGGSWSQCPSPANHQCPAGARWLQAGETGGSYWEGNKGQIDEAGFAARWMRN